MNRNKTTKQLLIERLRLLKKRDIKYYEGYKKWWISQEAIFRPLCNEIERVFMYGLFKRRIKFVPQFKVKNRKIDFVLICKEDKLPEDTKVGLEINGSEFHTGLINERRDFERDLELTQGGWDIYYFTGKDVYHDLEGCLDFCESILQNKGGTQNEIDNIERSLVTIEIKDELEELSERIKDEPFDKRLLMNRFTELVGELKRLRY